MRRLLKSQRGVGLIEVITALGLLGIIGIAFLGALATASTAIITADGRSTAESMARSELEYIRSQDYIDYSQDPHGIYDSTDALPNYIVETTVQPFDPDGGSSTEGIYAEYGGVFEHDDGIQLITVTVSYFEDEDPEDRSEVILSGFKTS